MPLATEKLLLVAVLSQTKPAKAEQPGGAQEAESNAAPSLLRQ